MRAVDARINLSLPLLVEADGDFGIEPCLTPNQQPRGSAREDGGLIAEGPKQSFRGTDPPAVLDLGVMPDPPRDYADRMDPGGALRAQMRGLALLANPPFSWALRLMGVPSEAIRDARAMPRQLEQHLANAERVAEVLSPRGWILFGLAPIDEYVRAVG